jgi:hypothetical protein
MARTLKHEFAQSPATDKERGMTNPLTCVRCGHAFASHVPELRPGYRACAEGTCVCDDLVKPLHLTQTGPPARMPLGRPGSAGLLSDPPGGPSTELRPTAPCLIHGIRRCTICPPAPSPTEAIRASRERHLAAMMAARKRTTPPLDRKITASDLELGDIRTHVPVAEVVIYQHAESTGKRAAINLFYIDASDAGVHIHEYGPGGLARSANCPRGCQP